MAREQARFDARETVTAGPMFGRKMFAAAGEAAEREAAVLQDAGLTPEAFHGFGKLLSGTRRHNLIYLDDLTAASKPEGVRLTFTLPAGQLRHGAAARSHEGRSARRRRRRVNRGRRL